MPLKNMYWVVEIRMINSKKCKMNKLLNELRLADLFASLMDRKRYYNDTMTINNDNCHLLDNSSHLCYVVVTEISKTF